MSMDEYHDMIALAKKYFQAFAAGGDVSELLSPTVEFFFPKFGVATGTVAFADLTRGLFEFWDRVEHDVDNFSYIAAGSNVVVEGTFSGSVKSGTTFRSHRFCAVFEIKNDRVTRLYYYTDPDMAGMGEARLSWSSTGECDVQ